MVSDELALGYEPSLDEDPACPIPRISKSAGGGAGLSDCAGKGKHSKELLLPPFPPRNRGPESEVIRTLLLVVGLWLSMSLPMGPSLKFSALNHRGCGCIPLRNCTNSSTLVDGGGWGRCGAVRLEAEPMVGDSRQGRAWRWGSAHEGESPARHSTRRDNTGDTRRGVGWKDNCRRTKEGKGKGKRKGREEGRRQRGQIGRQGSRWKSKNVLTWKKAARNLKDGEAAAATVECGSEEETEIT